MVSYRLSAIFNALLLGSMASGQVAPRTVDEEALLDFARSFPVLTTLEGLVVNATQTRWLDPKNTPQYKGFKTQAVNYYCSFYGVNCNGAGGVDSINLDSSGLRGSLPTSMGSFSSLTYFSVGANYIFDTIPSEVGKLTALHTLRIFDNDVLGTIPTSISLLTNMVSLELDVNYLTGSVPDFIGTLTKLTTCHLYDNSLVGVIPSNIGNLINLNYLRWEFNFLAGTIPSAISRLTALHTMHLNNNDLGGTIPSTIGTMTKLKDVLLAQNFLSGTIPNLSALEKLLILDLSSNKLTMGGASVLSDTVFSPLTLMGPLNLSNNCINFPPKFKAIASCKIPTPAPTSISMRPIATPSITPKPVVTDDDAPADDEATDDEAADDDEPEPPTSDDDNDDDGDDDVVDTIKTTISQDFTFVGTVKEPEMLEFQMAVGTIVIKLLGLPDSDIINFVSLVKTPIKLLASRSRALAAKVEYTLVFSILSTSGKSSGEIVMLLSKIVMDGRLNRALAEAGFGFTVTATKGPTIVQANSEKSSSIAAGGSTSTRSFGAGLAKSPLWALVALLVIPLIACAVCVYVGYRCKRKEKKNVMEGITGEDTEAEMYATSGTYTYPPEEKKVTIE